MVSAGQIRIDHKGALKSRFCYVRNAGLAVEFVQQPEGAPQPGPGGRELRIVGNAEPEQIACSPDGIKRPFRKQFLAADKACIGSLFNPRLTRHGQSKSIPKFGNSLNCVVAQHLSQLHDDVGEIGLLYVYARPQG